MHLFWVGPRESDIYGTESMFQGTITFFGTGNNGNTAFCGLEEIRINHNVDHPEVDQFILRQQQELIKQYPDCKFMSYNPNCLVGITPEQRACCVCLNPEQILNLLDDKQSFRNFASQFVPTLPFSTVSGKNCTIDFLGTQPGDGFVVQEACSSGGEGTYILTHATQPEIANLIDPGKNYLVSKFYKKNIPLNMHLIIFGEQVLLFPASIQVVVPQGNRLLYRGADYVEYCNLPETVQQTFREYALVLGREIQKLGYRGVIGIDAMWTATGELFILEANDRFQGSSVTLNQALKERGLPSLQQYHLQAFSQSGICSEEAQAIRQLKVPYSSLSQIYCDGGRHGQHMHSNMSLDAHMVAMLADGYHPNISAQENAHLFTQLFDTNIVSICPKECCVRLHPNLYAPERAWYQDIQKGDLLKLKISLLNQGACISPHAREFIRQHGQMREGTYFSLDLFVRGAYMNCPLSLKFTCYSPFLIHVNEAGTSLCLLYYGEYLTDVDYDKRFVLPETDLPLDKICFLATDRLRLQNNSYCIFPKQHSGCCFCEVTAEDQCFTAEDVIHSIETVFSISPRPFRHVLIGGASKEIGKEYDTIVRMCKTIRAYSDMPIYLMCLPPARKEIIEQYVQSGVTEFGFNMEVYDSELACRFMPGKGRIPRQRYLRALSWAADLVGHEGSVRCAFVVGLEPEETLLAGIEAVCQLGVAPILSVFRPIPFTEMADVIPPNNEALLKITEKAARICRKYGLELGPQCPACRNNTLNPVEAGEALPYRKECCES